MAQLPKAMAILQAAFDEHAGKDGDPKTLSKKELSQLLHCAFPQAVGGNMDKFFKELDCDGDGVVDFGEYVTFVAALTTVMKD